MSGRFAVFGADCEPTNPSAVFVPVVPGVGRSVNGATVEPIAVGDLVATNPQGRAEVAIEGSGARVFAQMDDVLTILDTNDDLDIYTGSRMVGPPAGPRALDDTAETFVDTAVTVDVLANDVGGSAVDPATLAVTATVGATATVVVTGSGQQRRPTRRGHRSS